ncbi:MAG: hypothetical protein KBG15_10240 [Kofleriaceae bacterium]|nr:hypothetical protein [Kofleriaceae bacterium]
MGSGSPQHTWESRFYVARSWAVVVALGLLLCARSAIAEDTAVVPPLAKAPLRLAVAPFANHSDAKALDWLVAGAPFEFAEKSETLLHLMPAYDALVVPATRVDETAASVAAFAAAHRADLVLTGYAERPNWELRVGATLWHIGRTGPKVIAETSRQGPMPAYHRMLGEIATELWSTAAAPPWTLVGSITPAMALRFERALALDIYAVTLLGRGLGYLTGALGPVDLVAAERDLKKAVFVAPTLVEGQRMLGELWTRMALLPKAEPGLVAKAGGKFSYATDLRADYPAALRSAGLFAQRTGNYRDAVDLLRALAIAQPWDIEVRFALGDSAWRAGDVALAQQQLDIVIGQTPTHVPALRVLALMAATRGDAAAYIAGLQLVAAQVPEDLDVKSDLAGAYTASGRWLDARGQLQQIIAKRPTDLVVWLRLADNFGQTNQRDDQLGALVRANAANPAARQIVAQYQAQLLFTIGKLAEADALYLALARERSFMGITLLPGAVEQARAAIAYAAGKFEVTTKLAKAGITLAPRHLPIRLTLIAALLQRRQVDEAAIALRLALTGWPADVTLHYFAGLIAAYAGDFDRARAEFAATLGLRRDFAPAQRAVAAINAGAVASLTVDYRPTPLQIWGGGRELGDALIAYAEHMAQLAATRANHQNSVLILLAELGRGPLAVERAKPSTGRSCPIGRVAPLWQISKDSLTHYAAIGLALEAQFGFLERHRIIGLGAALPLDQQQRLALIPREFALVMREIAELRAQWERGVLPELRNVNCSEALLDVAARDPSSYPRGDVKPASPPPAVIDARPPPTVKFKIDNTNCRVAVAVWLDGRPLGTVERKSIATFNAPTGQHTLCLLSPSSPPCGDRGTVRQLYLHEGSAVSMRCPV